MRTGANRAFRSRLFIAGSVASAAMSYFGVAQAATVLWSSATGNAYLTGGNWTGGAAPGSADVAQVGANPTPGTAIGINMNGSTNNGANSQAVGAIEVTNARLVSLTVGNSSTVAAGTLTLNGATVNSVSNTIIRNNSAQSLTIANTITGGTQTMGLTVNTGANQAVIDATGAITISDIITATGAGGIKKIGGAALTISNANNITGTFVLANGTLSLTNSTALGTAPLNINWQGGTTSATNLTKVNIANGLTIANNITIDANSGNAGQVIGLDAATSSATLSGTITINQANASGGHFFGSGSTGLLTITGAINSSQAIGTSNAIVVRQGGIKFSGGGTYNDIELRGAGTNTTVLVGATNGLSTSANVKLGGNGNVLLDLNGFDQTVVAISDFANATGTRIVTNSNASQKTLTLAPLASSTYTLGTVAGSGINGNLALTLNGSSTGTESFTTSNAYTGPTTLTSGTLAVSVLANGGSNSGIGSSASTASNLVFDGGTLSYTGGNVATNRDFTINSGKTAVLGVSSAATSLTMSGSVSSTTGALTKVGSGTLILSGTNSYSGTTRVSLGTLQANTSSSIGSGAIEIFGTGGTTTTNLNLSAGVSIPSSRLFTIDTTSGRGSVVVLGSGVTTIDSNISITSTGATSNSSNAQFFISSGTSASADLTINGNITATGSYATNASNTNGLFQLRSNIIGTGAAKPTGTINGNISLGNNALLLNQNGENTFTWIINGASNSWTATSFLNGTLKMGSTGVLPTSAKLYDNGGGTSVATLDLNGTNQTVAGLDATNTNLSVTNNSATTDSILTVNTGASTYSYAGKITDGTTRAISLTFSGGTQTLSAANTYSGNTQVTGGQLSVTGSLANNGSNKIFIASDPGGVFGTGDDIKLTRTRTAAASSTAASSYAGFGSTEIGGLASSAQIMAGFNDTAGVGGSSDSTVAMQWRQRAANETNLSSPPLPPFVAELTSDVLHLTGMVNTGAASGRTDPFALQMTYDATKINNELAEATAGNLYMLWLDPSGTPQWKNAVLGNFGAGTTITNYQGSWATFASANSITDANVGTFLGSWGVDIANDTVWAVINHNSDFAVVPEPASLTAVGMAGVTLVSRRRRRK